MCVLCANTTPFYIWELSNLGFWYLWGTLETIPLRYWILRANYVSHFTDEETEAETVTE